MVIVDLVLCSYLHFHGIQLYFDDISKICIVVSSFPTDKRAQNNNKFYQSTILHHNPTKMIFSEFIDCKDGRYIGFIESPSGMHNFSVVQHRHNNEVDISTLVVGDDLGIILGPLTSKPWFTQRINSCKTVSTLAKELQNIVNELAQQNSFSLPTTTTNNIDLPQLLMRHMDELGWERVLKVNEDLTAIQMKSMDSAGREHAFDVIIPAGYPQIPPTIQATLPVRIELPWTTGSSGSRNLLIVAAMVDKEVKRFEKLFDELSEIDNNAWVLEPSQPTFATTSRRLAIERSCSVVIEINPDNPRDPCNMQFFGPPNRVNHFRILVGQHLHRWSKEKNVRENLELVLDIQLPNKHTTKSTEEAASMSEECGICYNYSLLSTTNANTMGIDGGTTVTSSVPDQACPNTKCCKMYHSHCLLDWLQSLPTTKSSFGTVFGTCIYCSEPISVRIQLK